MHPQLAKVEKEYTAALAQLRRLRAEFDENQWHRRPVEGSWSAAECVAHLNITSRACLAGLDSGLDEARRRGRVPERGMRRDLFGWLLWKGSQPNPRMKIKTGAAFVPSGDEPVDALIGEFERLQEEQLTRLRSADGLPIDKVKVVSAFVDRIRYSVYSLFTILSIHQLRHLGQAGRALRATGG